MPEATAYLSINDIGPLVATFTNASEDTEVDLFLDDRPVRAYRGPKLWRADVPHCPDRQFQRLHILAGDFEQPVEVRIFGPMPGGPVYVSNAWLTVDLPHDMTMPRVCWALSLRSIGELRSEV